MRPRTTRGKAFLAVVVWAVVYYGLTAGAGVSNRVAGAAGAGAAMGCVQVLVDELDRTRGDPSAPDR